MTKLATVAVPDLVLAIDLGGSQTKAIASVPASNGFPMLLCMEPEIADVSAASVRNYEKTKSGEVDPENTCWVGIDEDCYAVGFLARHKYGGNSLLKQLKEESAVPKICGALWVLRQRLKLTDKLTVALSVLLPPSEYQDRERLEVKLRRSLRRFNTPTGEMRVKLVDFNAKPEGGGIYLYRRSILGADIKNRNVAVVMLGHRNASVLVSTSGSVAPGVSSTFGMSWMLDDFVRRCSGLVKEDPRLMAAIVAAGTECNPEALAKLSRRNSSADREGEAQEMSQALKLSRDEYFRALVRWLSQELPRDMDEIILCGGTAEYLKPELEVHYSNVKVIWNGGVEILPGLDTVGMGARIADVWALYQVFFGVGNLIKKDSSSTATGNVFSNATPATVSPALEGNVVRSIALKPKGFLEMPEKL
jgi:hypothetical protein